MSTCIRKLNLKIFRTFKVQPKECVSDELRGRCFGVNSIDSFGIGWLVGKFLDMSPPKRFHLGTCTSERTLEESSLGKDYGWGVIFYLYWIRGMRRKNNNHPLDPTWRQLEGFI